jgi:hypothetical protein
MYYRLKLEEDGNHNEDIDKDEELQNEEEIFYEIAEQSIPLIIIK